MSAAEIAFLDEVTAAGTSTVRHMSIAFLWVIWDEEDCHAGKPLVSSRESGSARRRRTSGQEREGGCGRDRRDVTRFLLTAGMLLLWGHEDTADALDMLEQETLQSRASGSSLAKGARKEKGRRRGPKPSV